MRCTEKELIDACKEILVWSRHMGRAAMGLYEEEKYFEMVKRSGYGSEYYMGMTDACHAVLLQLIGGKELMKLDEELWNSDKDEEELN